MKLARVLIISLATALGSVAGCASDDDVGFGTEDLTEIAFEQLEVSKFEAPEGLTVLKNEAAFVDFFGGRPPDSVDFTRHWVVHVSAGIKNSGGYGIEIVNIVKQGSGQNRKLVVYGHATSPGLDCAQIQVITNPQMTVRINKQPGTPNSSLQLDSEVINCGPGTCADAGGECKSSPTDVTFPANCKDDFAMEETNSSCPAINQACCVPVECGGFAGLTCPDDAICVDDPSDSCDPQNGGADCGGICTKKIACAGFGGLACPNGMTCIDDPSDDCDPQHGGADCGGLCVEQTCDATLICTQALTCVDGNMYPTGCGPANCDAPIGDC